MKKALFIFSLSLFVLQLNAQDQTINGTTFKQDGKVGIGTTSPNHELTVEGASSPNIELKNSNYSNGGFVLNRTNYGNQWKWWAQNNVMYFDFSTDETNYSNKLTIKSNGNIGIGVTNPEYGKLHVKGNGSDQGINLWTASGETTSRIWIDNLKKTFHLSRGSNPVKGITINNDGLIGIGETNPQHGNLHINGNGASYGINLWTNSGETTSRIWINNQEKTFHITKGSSPLAGITISDNGLVGIGETNPDSKLTVTGNVNVGGTGNYHLKTRHIDGKEISSTNVGDLYLNHNTGERVLVGYGGLDSNMYVSGNVGIGTTDTQGFKLGVNGDIAALEVKIATYTNWPDYVFNDTYNLPALEEVEQQIKDSGHLKDIPSAETVKEEGFFLGDMDAKLLQKIEELTLYTIEQEKKLEKLAFNNTEQQKKIEKLEKENAVFQSLSKRLAAIEALLSNQKQ